MEDSGKSTQEMLAEKRTNKTKFDVNNFLIIAAVGIIILTCVSAPYTEDGSTGPANTGLWGFGFVLVALFGLLIYAYRDTLRRERAAADKQTAWQFAMAALTQAGAPGTMLFVVLCIMSMNAQYYTQINKGIVAPEYYTYNSLAVVIVMVQMAALYRLFQTKAANDEGGSDAASALIYLLSMAGVVTAGIMNIILTFFSTDG